MNAQNSPKTNTPKENKNSLTARVLLVSVCFFIVPLCMYQLWQMKEDFDNQLANTFDDLKVQGETRAASFAIIMDNLRTKAKVIENFYEEKNFDNSRLTSIAQDMALQDIHILQESIDLGLSIVGTSWRRTPTQILPEIFYSQPPQANQEYSFFATEPQTDERLFYFIKRFPAKANSSPFWIVITLKASDLMQQMLLQSKKALIDYSILNQDRIVFYSTQPSRKNIMLESLTDEKKLAIKKTAQFAGDTLINSQWKIAPVAEDETKLLFNMDNALDKRLGVIVSLPGTTAELLLDTNKDILLINVKEKLKTLTLILLFIITLSGYITWRIAYYLSQPLRNLGKVMLKVADGDFDERFTPSNYGYELNRLGLIFNDTIDYLLHTADEAMQAKIGQETITKELEIGNYIQKNILPVNKPDYANVEIACRFEPAKQVGGDFYDWMVKEAPAGDQLLVTVADASGKGISACLYSLCLRSLLRSYYCSADNPADMLRLANNLFIHDTGDSGNFVTAFLVQYLPQTRTLAYANCGHTPALLKRHDGSIELLKSKGLVAGFMELDHLEMKEVQIGDGDVILLYTDGVTEAQNTSRVFYGEERLVEFFSGLETDTLNAEEIAEQLHVNIKRFEFGAEQFDDTTFVVLKFV